jgi:hypothetical protein
MTAESAKNVHSSFIQMHRLQLITISENQALRDLQYWFIDHNILRLRHDFIVLGTFHPEVIISWLKDREIVQWQIQLMNTCERSQNERKTGIPHRNMLDPVRDITKHERLITVSRLPRKSLNCQDQVQDSLWDISLANHQISLNFHRPQEGEDLPIRCNRRSWNSISCFLGHHFRVDGMLSSHDLVFKYQTHVPFPYHIWAISPIASL